MLYTKRRSDGRSYFYWRARYIDSAGLRRTKRLATGIVDDGTPEAKRNAEIIGHRMQAPLAAGGERAARSAITLKQALTTLVKTQRIEGRHDASIAIIVEKSLRLYEFFGPQKYLHDIGDDDVLTYAVQARKGSAAAGIKPRQAATVYRELLVLSQAFGVMKAPKPKFPKIEVPRGTKERMLEISEQTVLLANVRRSHRLHVLVMLQLGVRRSEMWKLGEVDWVHRRIRVHGTKTSRAVRWVPLPKTLFAELYERRETWSGLAPWDKADRDLKDAAKRAGIAACSCNDLRRTYATFMARAGVQPLQLARYMGTSVKMLEEVYARIEKPGEHDHQAVALGVPDLGALGVHSVSTETAPEAETTVDGIGFADQTVENTSDFQPEWPTVQ